MTRKLQTLCSLLLAAGLLLALPGTLTDLTARGRTRLSERLTPPEARTFSVWIVEDTTAGLAAIKRLCAAFEKKNAGVRVFLRQADAAELLAPDAALPDVVIFSPCALREPEKCLLPIAGARCREDALAAGRSGLTQYAVPLWLAPHVLAVPTPWVDGAQATPAPPSYFSLLPAATPEASAQPTKPPGVPWARLCEPGALQAPQGVGWQQLLLAAPAAYRARLIASLAAGDRSAAPRARVQTLAAFRQTLASGEALAGFPLPAISQDVALLGVCRDSALCGRFLALALAPETQNGLDAYGLVGLSADASGHSADALGAETAARYARSTLLPNAFACAREELFSLCAGDFRRGVDPVETLVRLR